MSFQEYVANWVKDELTALDAGLRGLVDIINPPNFWSRFNPYFLFAKGYSDTEGMATIIEPIAFYILTICWLISFIKLCINMDILKTKFMFKVMTLGILARAAIDNAFVFLGAIYATGAGWTSKIAASENFTVGTNIWNKMQATVEGYGLFESLAFFIASIIFIYGLKGVMIFIKVKAYARLFELTMTLGMAPLPFAFLPLEGGGSRITKKYIFNFASICLEGFFMIASIKLFQTIVVNILSTEISSTSNPLTLISQVFTYTLILLLAITSSSKWAKQIFEGA